MRDKPKIAGYRVIEVIAPRADALFDLARRVDRLCPHHRFPERFHEDKSEIAAALRKLAREVKHG